MTGTRAKLICGAVAVGVLAAVIGLRAGLRKAAPPAGPPAEAEAPGREDAVVPALPGDARSEETAGMDILVKNPNVDRSADEDAYQRDGKLPAGRLVVACKWAGNVAVTATLPPPKPVDLDAGNMIRRPVKGEVEYYKNLRLKERRYIGSYRGFYPTGVVLMLRDIKAGQRPMYNRSNYMVRYGRFRPHIQFAPVHERVMFGTYDSYPTEVVMRDLQAGKVVLDAAIAAFDRDTIKPLGGGGVHYTRKPTMQQSEVLHRLGTYEIRGKRHLWKKAYLVVVDNPYAEVVDRGRVAIEAVPVGRWRLDVWHPEFAPVKQAHEIEIGEAKTTELAVEFHPPAVIRPKPKGGKVE